VNLKPYNCCSLLLCATALVGGLNIAVAQGEGNLIDRTSGGKTRVGSPVKHCRSGPWGDLEYFYFNLEAPDEFVRRSLIPSEITVWRFAGMSPGMVEEILKQMDLPEPILKAILDPSQWYVSDTETRILPKPGVILNLTPAARARIYSHARPWKENGIFFKPIAVEFDSVEQWFEGLDLPPRIPPLVQRLAYPQGEGLVFSDIPFILNQLESESQCRAFLKALTRTRSINLHLRISDSTDLRSLAEYWSSKPRFKQALPLLESVARVTGVEAIDVTHFLPPLPRKHLYTFPSLNDGYSGHYPDGFWTALNFFRFSAIEDLPDEPAAIESYLKAHYVNAPGDHRFGDMVVLRDPEGETVMHAAICIADDIVYTKNGEGIFRPWTLMKMDSMLLRWSHHGKPRVEYWRLKDESATSAP